MSILALEENKKKKKGKFQSKSGRKQKKIDKEKVKKCNKRQRWILFSSPSKIDTHQISVFHNTKQKKKKKEKENSNQRVGESKKKEKRKFLIKDRKKTEETSCSFQAIGK